MSSPLATLVRLPLRAGAKLRRHPWWTLAVIFVLLSGTAFGVWRYAMHQWEAAQVAVKEERTQDAKERLAFCLRVWPRSTEVHVLAARAARLNGDLQAAERYLNRCLELEGGATEAVQLEFLLMRAQGGEIDELAPALFELVEKGHPDSQAILETISRTYILRLRYKPAFACLSRWIEYQPDNPKPYQWRGWSLERLNNAKAAMTDYQKALELDPEQIPVRLRIAEMYLEDKQTPDALPHLERLYEKAPNDPLVQARLGMCRFLQGRAEEARTLMEAAVVHLPKDPALLVTLANLDLQDGRITEAEQRLRTVLAEDPSDTEALFVLAPVLQAQGRTQEAAEVLADFEKKRAIVERINELLKDAADSPTARADEYAEIGELFLQIGREKFGQYWSERALERDPTNQRANQALAAYYEKKGDAEKAAHHRRQLRPPGK